MFNERLPVMPLTQLLKKCKVKVYTSEINSVEGDIPAEFITHADSYLINARIVDRKNGIIIDVRAEIYAFTFTENQYYHYCKIIGSNIAKKALRIGINNIGFIAAPRVTDFFSAARQLIVKAARFSGLKVC